MRYSGKESRSSPKKQGEVYRALESTICRRFEELKPVYGKNALLGSKAWARGQT